VFVFECSEASLKEDIGFALIYSYEAVYCSLKLIRVNVLLLDINLY